MDIKEFPNWMGICIIIKIKKDTKFNKEEKMFNSFNYFSSLFEFFFTVRVKLSNVKTEIVL